MGRKLLYGLIVLLVLLSGLIVLSAFRPEITDRLADWLYEKETGEAGGEPGSGVALDLSGAEPGNVAGTEPGNGTDAEPENGADAASENGTGTEPGNGAGMEPGSGTDAEPGNGAGMEPGSGADAEPGSGADAGPEDRAGLAPESAADAGGYVPPDASDIRPPQDVAGKTGYQPVQEDRAQVDEQAADALARQLGTGETGDGLSFDPLYYPFYAMLDETGQHLYRQIYANAQVCHSRFAPIEPIGAGAVKNVFEAVCNDHPELFWLDTAYACKYRRNGQCVEIDLKFNRTADDLEQAEQAFTGQAERILEGARALPTDYERERYVHDALIDRADYRLSAPMNQSAYSALVGGETVCAGYARAMQYLLQQLQIPCYYCTGYAGEAHAWNIVALDDGFYNVDATWDDTGDGDLTFFNRTDADYADTHLRQDLSVYLPPCDGQKYRTQTQETNGLRSPQEAGIAPGQTADSLTAYYERCREAVRENAPGDFTFAVAVSDEALLREVLDAYRTQRYRDGYLDAVMEEVGAQSGTMRLEAEPLADGSFLLRHEVSLH